MIKTVAQAKALIRATTIESRLDLLTEVCLETDSKEIERFTENYRWVLGQGHRKQLKENLARLSRLEQEALVCSQGGCDGMDGEE